MHSDCKHLAIEHQVVLCCQPIQLMNSCLTEHGRTRRHLGFFTVFPFIIIRWVVSVHWSILDFFLVHSQEFIHLPTSLSLAHEFTQLVPFSLRHVRSQDWVIGVVWQRIPLLAIAIPRSITLPVLWF